MLDTLARRRHEPPSATPYPTRTTPWKHQRQAVSFLFDHPGALLYHDMGTGKTKSTIDFLCNSGAERVLLVCPKSVMPAWETQWALHATKEANIVLLTDKLLAIQKKDRVQRELMRQKVWGGIVLFVVNYESVWRDPLGPYLLDQRWDAVIADESHRIKSPRGRSATFFAKLGKVAKRRIALTGTPMPNDPRDAYMQFYFLDPTIFTCTSYWQFMNYYCRMGGYDQHEFLGIKPEREREFHDRFYSVAHRVKKEEVLDLPPLLHVERTCRLNGVAEKHYKRLSRDFITFLSEEHAVTAANAMVKLLRFQQLTGGFLRDESGTDTEVWTGKAELLRETLEELPQREPVVVFCQFTHDLATVKAVGAALGRSVGELSGHHNALAAWQRGETDILAVQWQAGGVGIDLTRAATCVLYSTGFSLGNYEQGIARVHRPGQGRPTTIVHLICEGTVDRYIYHALEEKRDVIAAVLERARKEGSL